MLICIRVWKSSLSKNDSESNRNKKKVKQNKIIVKYQGSSLLHCSCSLGEQSLETTRSYEYLVTASSSRGKLCTEHAEF